MPSFVTGYEQDVTSFMEMNCLGLPTSFSSTSFSYRGANEKKIFECNLCDIKVNSESAMINHINGKRHLKMMIRNPLKSKQKIPTINPAVTDVSSRSQLLLDESSRKRRFGWFSIDQSSHFPYVVRYEADHYVSVRMVERRLIDKYLQLLPPEVTKCSSICSYYVTDTEAKLLNEINLKHSNGIFGKEAFTRKDLVVQQLDVEEFYRFLDLCHRKLILKTIRSNDRCGFVRTNNKNMIPYILKDGLKYLPLFYFEGETHSLKLAGYEAKGWDLSYLKFCCKIQGIELFDRDSCKMVSLEHIKNQFPASTTFKDYWPPRDSLEPICTRRSSSVSLNWTQMPASSIPIPVVEIDAVQLHQLKLQDMMKINHFMQADLSVKLGNKQTNNVCGGTTSATGVGRILQQSQTTQNKQKFPGKLTKIKEFITKRNSSQPAYQLHKARLDEKFFPCINVRPFEFHDLMMSLPDFVNYFFPGVVIEQANEVLETLKVVLYKGNIGHQDVLRAAGKCKEFDPVPLVLVTDIVTYLSQMKFMISNTPAS